MNILVLEDENLVTDERKALLASDIHQIIEDYKTSDKKYKNRFLVKFGDNIQFKNTEEIAYFFVDNKITYLVLNEGQRFIVDYRLEQLQELLDPECFFRLNRKFVIKIESVQKIKLLNNSRLQVFLKPNFEQDIFVSKEKATEFKNWLDQ
jgi:two-component system, LytTR family, response regulator LytT